MTATASVTQPSDPALNALVGNTRWASGNVTFSFPGTAAYYEFPYGPNNETTSNFGAFTTTQQNWARAAIAQFANVANLNFTEYTSVLPAASDYVGNATIRLALSDAPSTAWAYLPSTSNLGGDVWFNKSGGMYNLPGIGNYAYATFVHELGHAMGLTHPHENGMPANKDSLEFTVMTYRSYIGGSTTSGYTNETWGYPQTLMMYDIAALQYMYGADFTTNSGNTTYSWSPTSGQMFINGAGQTAPGANRIFMTLWDGGGTDTYDFSNYASGVTVDLRPGEWTTTSSAQLARLHYNGSQLARGNIANALQYNGDARSLIENAIGGSGSDTIIGNAATNTLSGGNGDDRIYGLWGNDSIDGGAGSDTAIFLGAYFQYTFTALNGGLIQITDLIAGRDAVDVLALIEFLQFTDVTVAATTLPLYPTIAIPAGWHVQSLGYFNAGGYCDILWRSDANEIGLWLMVDGEQQSGAILSANAAGWSVGGTGDFNNDGTSDVLWRSDAGQIATWQMSNGQIVATPTLSTNVSGWSVSGVGDFNNTAGDDILWRSDGGAVGIWFMVDGLVGSTSILSSGVGSWSVAGIGDFNGDGNADILWRSSGGAIGTWQMVNGQIGTTRDLSSNVNGWTVAGTGDFNGDGTSDILWRSDAGMIACWNMANGLLASTHDFGVTSWSVVGVGDFDNDAYDDIMLSSGASLMIWPTGPTSQSGAPPAGGADQATAPPPADPGPDYDSVGDQPENLPFPSTDEFSYH